MSNECYNYLHVSGNENQIDEFMNLITYRDKQYRDSVLRSNYIDCRGMVTKSKGLKNKEVIDFIKQEIFQKKIIGYEMEKDGDLLYFKTDWSPYVTPLLYISNLFPEVSFRLSYDEPGLEFEGLYEFQNGHLLTDYVLEKMDRGWKLKIHKTKFKTVDGFKKHYGLNRLRNVSVEVCEEITY